MTNKTITWGLVANVSLDPYKASEMREGFNIVRQIAENTKKGIIYPYPKKMQVTPQYDGIIK